MRATASRLTVPSLMVAGVVGVVALLAGGVIGGRGQAVSITIAIGVCVLGLSAHAQSRFHASRDRDTVASLALASAAAALATITWNGVRVGPGLALCDAFLVLTAILLTVRVLAGHRLGVVIPVWAMVPGYMLLMTGFMYALYSGAVIADGVPALRFAVALTLTPIVIAAAGYTPRRRDILIGSWVLGAAVSCLAAVSDLVGVSHFGDWLTGVDYGRIGRFSGLSVHPNHLAIASVMALPVALNRFSTAAATGRNMGNLVFAVCSGVLALGILLSGSRAGFVVAVVAIMAIVFTPGGDSSARLRSVVGIVVAGGVVVAAATSLAGGNNLLLGADRIISPTGGELASNAGRQESFATAISAFAAHPVFGVGFAESRSAVNIYLQLLQAGGILGFAAFMTALASAVTACYRLARDALLSVRERQLAGALSIALMSWLTFGLFQNTIYDRFLFVPIGFALALLGTHEHRQRVTYEPALGPPRGSELLAN